MTGCPEFQQSQMYLLKKKLEESCGINKKEGVSYFPFRAL
jgi:hypothetical protein